jgi:hypothetical protein
MPVILSASGAKRTSAASGSRARGDVTEDKGRSSQPPDVPGARSRRCEDESAGSPTGREEMRLRKHETKVRRVAHHLVEHHYMDRIVFEAMMRD